MIFPFAGIAGAAKPGIADRYPGDAGIDKDPRVVFVEDFESGSLAAVKKHWNEVNDKHNNLKLDAEVPSGSSGQKSLLISHVGGKGHGGHLFREMKPGFEKLHARWYVKFDPACAQIHHFGTHMGGYNPPTRWPNPKAGNRPAGDKRFLVGIEPYGKAWRWDFYAYWCEMRPSPPRGRFWGHDFVNDPNLKVVKGKWICVEVMIKLNDVGDTNGEQAFWIDGKLWKRDGQIISHLGKGFPKGKWVVDSWHPNPKGKPFEGMRWRTSKQLLINNLWTYLYITKAPKGHLSKVWFDHIVVARDYIGPMKKK